MKLLSFLRRTATVPFGRSIACEQVRPMRVSIALTAGAIALTASTTALTVTLRAQRPLQIDLDIRKTVLENGLTLLSIEDHSAPKINLMQYVRMGSRDEYQGTTGMSHRLEHLILKPSGGNAALYAELEKVGYSFGGHTFNDMTDYIMQVPPDSLELAVRVWASHLEGLNTSPEVWERERQVQINEFANGRTNAEIQILQRLYSMAYMSHPYQWRASGWESDVANMALAQAQAAYDRFYVPVNTVLIVGGDFQTDELIRLVKKHYGPIPARPAPVRSYTQEIGQSGSMDFTYRGPSPAWLYVAYHVPAYADPQQPLVQMIAAYLAKGRNSALGRRLREVADRVQARDIDLYRADPALLVFKVELKRADQYDAALRTFTAVVEDLQTRLLSADDVERVRNHVETDFVSCILHPVWRLWTQGGKSHWIGQNYLLTGDVRFYETRLDAYRAATPELLRTAARKYLDPTGRIVVRSGQGQR